MWILAQDIDTSQTKIQLDSEIIVPVSGNTSSLYLGIGPGTPGSTSTEVVEVLSSVGTVCTVRRGANPQKHLKGSVVEIVNAPSSPTPSPKTVTYTRSVASMSWIDPKSGLPEVDKAGNPGQRVPRALIVGRRACRFANLLEAQIVVDPVGKKIISAGFTQASGQYMNQASFMGILPQEFPTTRRQIASDNGVTFIQTCCSRTQSPEVIGEVVGSTVPFAVAGRVLWVLIKAGETELYVLGSILTTASAMIAGFVGKEAAKVSLIFPPIWTELHMKIGLDGRTSGFLVRQSLFPSMNFYKGSDDNKVYSAIQPTYNAVPNLTLWSKAGWGPVGQHLNGTHNAYFGNPLNMASPAALPPLLKPIPGGLGVNLTPTGLPSVWREIGVLKDPDWI